MGKSLFWKGVLYGALAGGALSLLDKSTRKPFLIIAGKRPAMSAIT